MNILLIGNGFDLAHGLPTKYTDFLDFIKVIKQIIKVDSKEKLDQINWLDIHPEIMIRLLKNIKNTRNNLFTQKGMWDDLIGENIWIDYFFQCDVYQRENWIDFEREISNVIQSLDDDMCTLNSKCNIDDNIINLSNSFLNKKYGEYTNSERIINTLNDMISFRTIRDKLLIDLNKFIRAFEIYLIEYIEKIDCTVISPDLKEIIEIKEKPGEILGCNILSFNYTSTCQRTYLSKYNPDLKGRMDYIHGRAEINNTVETNNMVLGIDEYLSENRRNKDVEFIAFKKFYQRIYKGTGCEYKRWVDQIRRTGKVKHKLYIFGHSLDTTDGDVLRDLILHDNVYTTIYYFNKDVMGQQIANLVKVIGQNELIKRTGGSSKTIKFKQQQEMVKM